MTSFPATAPVRVCEDGAPTGSGQVDASQSPTTLTAVDRELATRGFFQVKHCFDPGPLLAELSAAIADCPDFPGYRRRGDDLLAIRDLDSLWPEIHDHAATLLAQLRPRLRDLASLYFVRAILFDKPAHRSWPLPWHRDLVFPVDARTAAERRPNQGQNHIKAPPALLAQMLTLRLHLDAADATRGGLRVIAGSHRHPTLSAQPEPEDVPSGGGEVICSAPGDLLVMRPALLHRSLANLAAPRRRIIHLEFSALAEPATGLRWPTQRRHVIH